LQPEVSIELSDKVKMDYFKIKVDDDSIDKYIEDLRKKNSIPTNPDKSQEGDVLSGKMTELDDEGKPKEGGIEKESTIGIDNIKLKTVQKKFIGKSIGDMIVFNPVKAMGGAKEAAPILGIDAGNAEEVNEDFQFIIESISRYEPAAINEEFFASVFPNEMIQDESQFRERLAKELELSFANESDRLFMRQTADKLIDDAKINLPDEFMKRWLMESGETQVKREDIDAHYDDYSRALKWQIIEGKIVKDNDLQVSADDVRQQIMSYFQITGDMDEDTRKRLEEIADNIMQNEEETKRIYDQLLDTRMRDLLKSTLTLKNKEVSYDDFIKLATETN
jgi:trigger factor